MPDQFTIPIICGPTGCGKTSAAVQLAEHYPVEVISADSRQVIKYLDIGTAKLTKEECNKLAFHLVDIVEPGETYSAYRFVVDAEQAIREILARRHWPVVVGGTGLYLKALTEGVVKINAESSTIRARLEEEMKELGNIAMYERLVSLDPDEASRLHPNNKVRIIRALEICELTGQSKTDYLAEADHFKVDYRFSFHCLLPDRDELYETINKRVDSMLTAGWLEELKRLVDQGWGERIARSRVIGYAELLEYLNGRISLNEAVEQIRQATRRYAKRQYTWFRHQAKGVVYQTLTGLIEGLETEFANRKVN